MYVCIYIYIYIYLLALRRVENIALVEGGANFSRTGGAMADSGGGGNRKNIHCSAWSEFQGVETRYENRPCPWAPEAGLRAYFVLFIC